MTIGSGHVRRISSSSSSTKAAVARSCVLHGVVVILETAGAFERILCVLAQHLSELVLAQRVRFAALGGVYAALSDMCSVSLTDGGQFIQRWLDEAERIA